ncbi:unnamed protein product [Arctogadus glacialis]
MGGRRAPPKREERLSNSAKPEFRATFPPGDGESGITSASGRSGITCAAGRSGTTHAAVCSSFAQPNPKCARHRGTKREQGTAGAGEAQGAEVLRGLP